VVHCDIKPGNIGFFLPTPHNHDSGFSSFDLGIAKKLPSLIEPGPRFQGTPRYVAPEVVSEKKYGFPADVWSYGQIFREFCGLMPLYVKTERDPEKIFVNINVNATMIAKSDAIEQSEEEDERNPVSDLEKWENLEKDISTSDNFDTCMQRIREAMCEVLPQHRPSVEQLRSALMRLEELAKNLAPVDEETSMNYYVNLSERKKRAVARQNPKNSQEDTVFTKAATTPRTPEASAPSGSLKFFPERVTAVTRTDSNIKKPVCDDRRPGSA